MTNSGIAYSQRSRGMIRVVLFFIFAATSTLLFVIGDSYADSVNSPNITLNVDTNRNVGAGAGNTAITVNTITVAETTLPEYSSGSGKAISISAKTGFRFVAGASITARSATIGINGGAINAVATQTVSGCALRLLRALLVVGYVAACLV